MSEKLGRAVTNSSPSPKNHYLGLYRWDELLADTFMAKYEANPELAIEGFETLLSHTRADGMIPNLVKPDIKRHAIDPEPKHFRYKHLSPYGQPPLEAMTARSIYDSLNREGKRAEAVAFLERNYAKIAKSIDYFDEYRRNDHSDPRIGVIHPHETGRDSDPTFDYARKWLKHVPYIGTLVKKEVPVLSKSYGGVRALANWHDALGFTKGMAQDNWRLERMRERFWFIDVMYNCMYADNLYEMAGLAEQLGKTDDQERYSKLAAKVERTILDRMWDPEARDGRGAFWGDKGNGEPVKVMSVSNLFPLILPNLAINQLESLVGLLEDDFKTRYPIPSVGKHEKEYDAHNFMKATLWRGGTWDNMNWYLVERGIRLQMKRPEVAENTELYTRLSQLADYISFRSRRRADVHGHPEFSHPEKGHGQRLAKEADFLWGTGAYHMPVYSDPNKATQEKK